MSKYSPSTLLTQAEKLSDTALKLAQLDEYRESVEKYKKSNRKLMKIVLQASNLEKSTGSDQTSEPVSNEILRDAYQLLGKNFDGLKKLSMLLDEKDNAINYLKKSEKYLSNYMKLSDDPNRYHSYLSNLFSTAITFKKFGETELALEYLTKFIKNLFKAIKEGLDLDELMAFEIRVSLDYYTDMVKNDPDLVKDGLELLLDSLNEVIGILDRNAVEDIYLFIAWLPFASQVLGEVALSHSELISDNEELFLKILNYIKECLINIADKETNEKRIIMGALSVFALYSNAFKDSSNIKTLFDMETDIYQALSEHGDTEDVIGIVSNLIDIIQLNPILTSNYILAKMYTELFSLLEDKSRPEVAYPLRETLLLILDDLEVSEIVKIKPDISDGDSEDDFYLTKANAYYYLSCIDCESNHFKEAREDIDKAKECINKIVNIDYFDGAVTDLMALINLFDRDLSIIEWNQH